MQQYSNCQDPTESEARKERLRHAEEQGDIEEAATRLAQSNLVTNHLEPEQVPNEETPERIPRSVQTPLKRKPGRPSLRRATPLSLAMISACIRKRRVSKATKSSKTIPCNEENTTKTIPRREENSSRTMPKKSSLGKTSISNRTMRGGTSASGPSRRATGLDFQILPLLFLKNCGMELPRVGEPLDSSKTPRNLQGV